MNTAAHGLLHARQHRSPVDLASVDSRLTGQPIPFAVLALFDSPTFSGEDPEKQKAGSEEPALTCGFKLVAREGFEPSTFGL
jgi:hypothetical protein